MVNDFLFLQITLFSSLIFFLFITENFFLLINSIIFLFLISSFLWAVDLDVYVNFLIIIDLGVFFVLIAFLINLSHLFQASHSFLKKSTLTAFGYTMFNVLLVYSTTIEATTTSNLMELPCTLSLYNWYSVYNFTYFSDLQLLSDLYYSFFSFEFVLMNFYLYLAIFLVYILLFVIKLFDYKTSDSLEYFNNNKTIFIRYQDLQKQVNQTATVRVWSKKKTKIF